jgi:UMF1 family MFS transporter
LFFSGPGDVSRTLMLFILAQVGFIAANVFYDAFINDIAPPDRLDAVSSKGYSYGYAGGGIQFALALALVSGHELIGISQADAVRYAMLSAALWWAGFALFTVVYLKETRVAQPLPEAYRDRPGYTAYIRAGLSRTIATTRRVKRFKHLALFLIAFMLYNDGVQTVIEIAGIYGAEELKLPVTTLMVTLLMIQMIAVAGAYLFSWIATRTGTRHAIMISLGLWSGVVIYAYFMTSAAEYFVLGAVVGIVLGGSQALSRSFYASIIPEDASAEFFGFYTVFSKFSAIWGPLAFGVISHWAGSSRNAILSLVFFFIVGMILLGFVDEKKARLAREQGPE